MNLHIWFVSVSIDFEEVLLSLNPAKFLKTTHNKIYGTEVINKISGQKHKPTA